MQSVINDINAIIMVIQVFLNKETTGNENHSTQHKPLSCIMKPNSCEDSQQILTKATQIFRPSLANSSQNNN